MHFTENLKDLERGFIDKDKILSIISEKDIFKLVFEDVPEEHEFVLSPFREDNSPGCWFSRDSNTGRLRFIDFGDARNTHRDCFDAVKDYYRLGNFYSTVEFVYERLIKNNISVLQTIIEPTVKKLSDSVPKKSIIMIRNKDYTKADVRYWKKYGITIDQLLSDGVYSIYDYSIYSATRVMEKVKIRGLGYAYTDFPDRRKKLYFPLKFRNVKFLTNCINDDIGGINSLPSFGDHLIVTKSYKDYRVIRNYGYNVVWTQSESSLPSSKTISNLTKNFSKVYVLFDSDSVGLNNAKRMTGLINAIYPARAVKIHISTELLKRHVKDPSDMYHKMGQKNLGIFLEQSINQ